MSPAFKYGLLAGLGSCLWIYAEFALGLHTTRPALGEWSGYLANLIPLLALTLLLRQVRADGQLTLGRGLRTGLYASLVAALLTYCFLLVHNQVIDPGWMDTALEVKVAQLRAQHMTELDVRAEIIAFRRMNSPLGLVTGTLLGMTLTGGLFSAIITLILRRQPADAGL
jgi:hypothetical protein